ncbi:MAG: alcohol dehydrogenase catalytic domain-containing protein, partial [Actinobacteria bacterium]|nr:alcohol dehydrogenase catalytic domain-containing protein [Actinomycetota bacterium]
MASSNRRSGGLVAAPRLAEADRQVRGRGARRREGRAIEAATAAPERSARLMQSAVIAAPGRIEIKAVPVPEPARGQVRVRLEGSGVCGSEMAVFEGRPWFEYPRQPGAPGHEGWGVVDAVGEGVDGGLVGRRVAALTAHAHAAYDIADEDAVVPLPRELDGHPFPGEALACAMNVFRRSEIRAGHTVAIVGVGFLGALLTRLAADAGARVVAIARRRTALDAAATMGATECVEFANADAVVADVVSLTDGELCDRVIEVTGKQEP